MTRLRRVPAGPPAPDAGPPVATLDEELWEGVGRLLVARGRLEQSALAAAVAEQRRTGLPLDEILVRRGYASRRVVASAVLLLQVGDELREQLRGRSAATPPSRAHAPLDLVPPERGRLFAAACLGADVVLISLASVLTAVAGTAAAAPLPPAGWMAVFAGLAVGLYWAWRVATFGTRLRPGADALLVAGSTSLAGLLVLTARSLVGTSGVAEELLPLWAFATVYGVAGRAAFYLAWPARPDDDPEPAEGAKEHERGEGDANAPRRVAEVVPIRPELWDLVDELRLEVDAIARGRQSGQELAGSGD